MPAHETDLTDEPPLPLPSGWIPDIPSWETWDGWEMVQEGLEARPSYSPETAPSAFSDSAIPPDMRVAEEASDD